jgi:hypothetical protein
LQQRRASAPLGRRHAGGITINGEAGQLNINGEAGQLNALPINTSSPWLTLLPTPWRRDRASRVICRPIQLMADGEENDMELTKEQSDAIQKYAKDWCAGDEVSHELLEKIRERVVANVFEFLLEMTLPRYGSNQVVILKLPYCGVPFPLR